MTQLEILFGTASPVGLETMPNLGWLRAQGVVTALDEWFARSLAAAGQTSDPAVLVAAALVSRQVRHGHVRLELDGWERQEIVDGDGRPLVGVAWPSPPAWAQTLIESRLATRPDENATSPLVIDHHHRVYPRRLFEHERSLAQRLLDRSQSSVEVSPRIVTPILERLFEPIGNRPDWTRVAALVAIRRRLCVLTGGPGTGKTTAVAKILAGLASLPEADRPSRMLLLAPTGKAARRLADAVTRTLAQLPLEECIRQRVPKEASTIHRALRPIRGNLARFRHHAENPLSADVVVVDEASMIDLALMDRLVAAIRPEARLILLGDADQLVSVEAGAAFTDVCNASRSALVGARLSEDAARFEMSLQSLSLDPNPMADCIVRLQHSWRFGTHSALGALARAILAGDSALVTEILGSRSFPEVSQLTPVGRGRPGCHRDLKDRIVDGYRPLMTASDPLSTLERFKVLCAHRGGPQGVETLNRLIDAWLADAHGMGRLDRRPVLITSNDYGSRLFNGDVGLWVEVRDRAPRVHFSGEEHSRWFAPARLPSHETAFAMSVHKSQGSEFDEVAVMLPAEDSPVLSRELLYTAVTRARQGAWVHGDSEVIARAIGRPVRRSSGLRELLWGDAG